MSALFGGMPAIDEDVEARLDEARALVDGQATRDLRSSVRAVLARDAAPTADHRRRFSRSVVMGLAAVFLIGATVAAAFGVRYLFISRVPGEGVAIDTGLPVGSGWDLGNEVTLQTAQQEAGAWLVTPSRLGEPDQVFLREIQGVHLVSLVYDARPGFPHARQGGPGLLLVEIGGTFKGMTLEKMVPEGGTIEAVDLGGVTGHWISGKVHEFAIDDGGQLLLYLVAGETLVWEYDGATYRLETRAGKDATVALGSEIVRELRALSP